jgi:hypothetical protein
LRFGGGIEGLLGVLVAMVMMDVMIQGEVGGKNLKCD